MWCLLFIGLFLRFAKGVELAVQLEPGTHPLSWAERNHVELVRALSFLPDLYLFETSHEARVRSLRNAADVVWLEPQTLRPKRWPRDIPDPLYAMQWSIHGHPFAVEVDKVGNLTGRGVVIAIVDDGLQHTHPEIRANYDGAHSYDFNDGDADPAPVSPHDGHGTAAAGVASAVANNGHCGRGVAPGARLVGLRLIADGVSDATEAEALTHEGLGHVDVYSSSWGPLDDGQTWEGPGYLTQSALEAYVGARRGRLGKASVHVWASGNGALKGDSCAYDGYASSPWVFAIGALDHTGRAANYSEGCSALVAVAPSSGAGRGITTADLVGEAGYTDGECTATFGGTSAATPLAAGLIALLLEAQPLLTWRDLLYVIARGSLQVDLDHGDWNVNAAGYHHSHRYGFGALHAPSLLRALAAHTLLANRTATVWRSGQRSLQDQWVRGTYNLTVNVSGGANVPAVVERVSLQLSLSSGNRGAIRVNLTSPEGTISVLAPGRPRDDNGFWPPGWLFHSVRHLGERRVRGDWLVTVHNADPQSSTHFFGYELTIMGA